MRMKTADRKEYHRIRMKELKAHNAKIQSMRQGLKALYELLDAVLKEELK